MTIYLHDKPVICEPGSPLQDILVRHKLGFNSLAAVLNHKIIARDDWGKIRVKENDRISLIPPMV